MLEWNDDRNNCNSGMELIVDTIDAEITLLQGLHSDFDIATGRTGTGAWHGDVVQAFTTYNPKVPAATRPTLRRRPKLWSSDSLSQKTDARDTDLKDAKGMAVKTAQDKPAEDNAQQSG
jgi:uncharacterized phage-like protein YoqJ